MGIRVNKLLTELNIGLATLECLLKSLGYKEDLLTINTKIPDDIAILVRVLFAKDTDYVKIIKSAADKGVYGIQNNRNPFIDYPGLEEYIWGDKKDVAFSYDNYATSIQDILTAGLREGKQSDTSIFGANGQLRRSYQRGLNIIKQKNRRARKVIRR